MKNKTNVLPNVWFESKRETSMPNRKRLHVEFLEGRTLLASDVAGIFGDALERLTESALGQANSESETLRITSQSELEGDLIYTSNGIDGSLELWKSDGTLDGTERVKAAVSNHADSTPGMTVVNGMAYFTVQHNEGGDEAPGGRYELWKSDGTQAGTELVKELTTWGREEQVLSKIIDNGTGQILVVVESSVFSRTTAQFWVSDGTDEGTRTVGPEFTNNSASPIGDVISIGDGWVFNGVDKQPDSNRPRYGIWSANSEGNVELVQEFDGDDFDGIPGPYGLVKSGDSVFFLADDGATGFELWSTDGTAAGTQLVSDVNPNNSNLLFGSLREEIVEAGGEIYFTADDGQHGRELWKSDGTSDGTMMVADITPGDSSSSLGNLHSVDGRVYFVVGSGAGGEELWTSDGSSDGTQRVATTDSFFAQLTPADGLLFFTVDDPTFGNELWVSDGTPDGTGLAADINNGEADSNPGSLFAFGGGLFFTADDGEEGVELWSLSTSTTSAVPNLPGDVDGDGKVAFTDFLVVAQKFGQDVSRGTIDGDIDGDGDVDFGDFLILSENFGKSL